MAGAIACVVVVVVCFQRCVPVSLVVNSHWHFQGDGAQNRKDLVESKGSVCLDLTSEDCVFESVAQAIGGAVEDELLTRVRAVNLVGEVVKIHNPADYFTAYLYPSVSLCLDLR